MQLNRIRIKITDDERQLNGSRSLKRINKQPGQLFCKNQTEYVSTNKFDWKLHGFCEAN